MDKVDRQIINYLLEDGSMPFSQIAEKIGISTGTVIRRYNSLREEGVIERATYFLNHDVTGIRGEIEFFIKSNPNADLDVLCKKIAQITNVYWVFHTLGDYDMLASAAFEDIDDLDYLMEELSKLKEINHFDFCMSTNVTRDRIKMYNKAYDPSVASTGTQHAPK